MSKRCELQKEYYQNHGNYKGNGKYSDSYVKWLEDTIIEIRNENKIIEEKQTMIDPPSGWKYGFPKPIPQDRLKDYKVWLVEQGYPQSEIDRYGENFLCRYWEK